MTDKFYPVSKKEFLKMESEALDNDYKVLDRLRKVLGLKPFSDMVTVSLNPDPNDVVKER